MEKLQARHPELDYYSLVENLYITSNEQSILTVGYVSPDRQKVSNVLDEISEAYLEYSLKERQQDINQAIQFVQRQINQGGLREQVKGWQEKLRTLQRVNNLIQPAQKAQQVSAQITSLNQSRINNRVELEQMLAQGPKPAKGVSSATRREGWQFNSE